MVHWCTGALVHWCTGSLVHWFTWCSGSLGALVHWFIGSLVHWFTSALVHQVNHCTGAPGEPVNRCTRAPVNRCTSEPVNQCTGEPVHRCTGAPGEPMHQGNQQTSIGEPNAPPRNHHCIDRYTACQSATETLEQTENQACPSEPCTTKVALLYSLPIPYRSTYGLDSV